MRSIISAVVKASGHGSVAEAIKANLLAVTDHCIKSIVSRQWRSREAGCAALRDVLASRTWEEVKDSLKDFWYYTLRAMDDMKESVRKSAQGTGRALSELSIYLRNPNYLGEEESAQAVDVVLSVLMTSFTHSAEEVRALVSKTLSEITRHGGTALRSSVPDLIANLLDRCDRARAANLKLRGVSCSLTGGAAKRSGLCSESGNSTRAATARLMSSVLQSRAVVMEPYAAKLQFSAASAAGMERNAMLRKAWCKAAGRGSKLCRVDEVAKYCKQN
ncbi:Proteasome component Ecm29 [Gracilaria domingensis]|nr:Proteasome component Ecm29 [Gracilaria domingensis]